MKHFSNAFVASDSSNTAEATTNQDATKTDNGSEEAKPNESTPEKGEDDDEDNKPTPLAAGMSPRTLNPPR